MRSIPRRIALLGLSALVMAFMAVGVSSAQAGYLEVYEGATGAPCPDLVVEGNDVSGGCLIEDMEGSFDLLSGGLPFDSYFATFDMREDFEGNVYAVNQQIGQSSWPREPCKDANGEVKPWPATSVPATVEMCIEGGSQYTQTVPFDTEVVGGYFLSMTQSDSPENGIANAHFDNEGSTEEVELVWVTE